MESARGGDPRQVARAELKLSKAFARYASDMRLAQGRDGLWRRGPEAQEAARRRGAAGSRTAQILQGLCGVDGMDEPPLSARAQAACAVGGTRRLRSGAAAASAQPGAPARAARTDRTHVVSGRRGAGRGDSGGGRVD